MGRVTLRFYAELNDLLPLALRKRPFACDFRPGQSVKHLIENQGVPHTEVELIIRRGESLNLDEPVADGDRLAVYPVFESFDARPLLRLRSRPLRRPRFVADAHLGALARRLRMLGFDTLWFNDIGDAALAHLAADQHRILLTRDRQLLMRQSITHGCYLRPGSTGAQLDYLIQRLDLCAEIAPFTRCTLCNAGLAAVDAADLGASIPPTVRRRHIHYWRCQGCGRLYWRGTHWQAMRRQIDSLCPGPAGTRGPARARKQT